MATALSEEEKERIRFHLGYMETNFAASLQFGIPRPVQTIFLLEQAMVQLQGPYAIQRCRAVLAKIDCVDDQLLDPGVALLYAKKLGELELREGDAGKSSTDLIRKEMLWHIKSLADLLGVPIYPYSRWGQMMRSARGNVSVRQS